jgi:serine/threonine-protein kinase
MAEAPEPGGVADRACLSDDEIAAFLDKRVSDGERAQVAVHLDGCTRCRVLLAGAVDDEAPSDPALHPTPFAEPGAESAIRLEPGRIVGERYRLTRQLGRGGMGVVWAADDLRGAQPAALKLLHASSPELRRRLLREARIARALRHPHVVRVDEVIISDGAPVLVMELLHGETLAQKLRRVGPLAPGEVAHVLLPAIRGVGYAHGRGVVHRDLKPDNLFLVAAGEGREATVKVLDFGIAKLTAEHLTSIVSGTLTSTGAIMGTPHYMSPEQLVGDTVDHRSDTWSLGVILYECLAGTKPFRGRTFGQLVYAIAGGQFEPLAQRAPHLPPSLCALVTRMLARDRLERPDLAAVEVELAAACGEAALGIPRPRSPARRRAAIVALSLVGGGLIAGAVLELRHRRAAHSVVTTVVPIAPPAAQPIASPPTAPPPEVTPPLVPPVASSKPAVAHSPSSGKRSTKGTPTTPTPSQPATTAPGGIYPDPPY